QAGNREKAQLGAGARTAVAGQGLAALQSSIAGGRLDVRTAPQPVMSARHYRYAQRRQEWVPLACQGVATARLGRKAKAPGEKPGALVAELLALITRTCSSCRRARRNP